MTDFERDSLLCMNGIKTLSARRDVVTGPRTRRDLDCLIVFDARLRKGNDLTLNQRAMLNSLSKTYGIIVSPSEILNTVP